MSTYNHTTGFRIISSYEDVDALRIDSGLVRILRRAKEKESEFHTVDPYITLAIVRLGNGETLDRYVDEPARS